MVAMEERGHKGKEHLLIERNIEVKQIGDDLFSCAFGFILLGVELIYGPDEGLWSLGVSRGAYGGQLLA
jgi:hypothetical protein